MTNLQRVSRPCAILLVAVFACGSSARGAPPPQQAGGGAGPAGVVRAFYRSHFARGQCCFDEAGLKARRGWFTPALYERMLREVRRQRPEDEAPYFNGDPFTDSQEGPVDFRIGPASTRGGRTSVSVTLRWADGRRTVERRTLSVELLRRRGAWRIDNIRYPDGTDFVTELQKAEQEGRQ